MKSSYERVSAGALPARRTLPPWAITAYAAAVLALLALAFYAGRSSATPVAITSAPLATAVTAVPPAAPGAAAAAVPAGMPPAVDTQGILWFDSRNPAVAAGATAAGSAVAGTWRRNPDTGAWAWTPVAPGDITRLTFSGSGQPPTPEMAVDPARIQVQEVVRPGGMVAGYWVWDPTHFAGEAGAGLRWSPRWVWADAGQPLQLAPAPDAE